MKKVLRLIIIIIIFALGAFFYQNKSAILSTKSDLPKVNNSYQQIKQQTTSTSTGKLMPEEFLLNIPFTPQAPTANWDQLHNEGCEEANALMINAYFNNDKRKVLPIDEVEKEIARLTNWQQEHFGYNLDTTTLETAQMIEEVYGLKTKLITDYSEKDLKEEIVSGAAVIIPVNGQRIANPYYKQPGPIYHMLLVRGFTKDKIITNDPGTKRGENYFYDFKVLKNAGADWDHQTKTIDQSKKIIIVVGK